MNRIVLLFCVAFAAVGCGGGGATDNSFAGNWGGTFFQVIEYKDGGTANPPTAGTATGTVSGSGVFDIALTHEGHPLVDYLRGTIAPNGQITGTYFYARTNSPHLQWPLTGTASAGLATIQMQTVAENQERYYRTTFNGLRR
jgi:hypothetical protein